MPAPKKSAPKAEAPAPTEPAAEVVDSPPARPAMPEGVAPWRVEIVTNSDGTLMRAEVVA